MKRIFRYIICDDNTLSILSYILVAFFEAGSIFLLARTYQKQVFGQWALYLTGITVVDMIRYGVLAPPLIKYISSEQESVHKKIIGAAWKLALLYVALLSIGVYGALITAEESIAEKGYVLFFKWVPVHTLVTLAPTMAMAVSQGLKKFRHVVLIRLLNGTGFLLFLVLNYFLLRIPIEDVCIAQIVFFALSSLSCIVAGWSCITSLAADTRGYCKRIFHFGKYSMGTTIGSSLLRGVDIFLIGIFLTEVDVALYTIPMRLYEVFSIPLMGLSAVAFPGISSAFGRNDVPKTKEIFYRYTFFLTVLFIPGALILYFLTDLLIFIFGGQQYMNIAASSNVFRIFLAASILLPVDRFSGTFLDGINRPKYTFYKVMAMVLVNCIGDIAVLHYFGSVEAVAAVTVVNIVTGTVGGYFLLKGIVHISLKECLSSVASLVREYLSPDSATSMN